MVLLHTVVIFFFCWEWFDLQSVNIGHSVRVLSSLFTCHLTNQSRRNPNIVGKILQRRWNILTSFRSHLGILSSWKSRWWSLIHTYTRRMIALKETECQYKRSGSTSAIAVQGMYTTCNRWIACRIPSCVVVYALCCLSCFDPTLNVCTTVSMITWECRSLSTIDKAFVSLSQSTVATLTDQIICNN